MVSYKKDLKNGGLHLNRVFVYGTLMKDFWNYDKYLKGRISRITPGITYGLLYHLPEGYPALLAGTEAIKGEVIEPVDENLIKDLDRLEGYVEGRSNNLYKREVKTVLTQDGEKINCWVYIYADERYAKENGILIPDGDWRKFMENRRN
ncbi:MAG: gamma-glutamylcyclotransferase [Clostridiales bacterium]|nr:gamma-glutamylcyclotransferase [Clostridiales bacterium]